MISKHAEKLPNMHSTEFRGLPLVVQWPRGSTRVGERPDGSTFKTEMKADYGYVPQTEAAGDEERLDVYIGPNENAEFAYAIEQLKDDGELDEWKIMLGFDSLEDAEAMYLAHNDKGWDEDHVGDIEEIPFDYLFDMVDKNQEVGKTANEADALGLSFPLTVYRAIKADELDYSSVGTYWTTDYEAALAYWSEEEDEETDTRAFYVLIAEVLKPEDVDWAGTLKARRKYPLEQEITVNSGTQLKLLFVEYNGEKFQKNTMVTAAAKTAGEHTLVAPHHVTAAEYQRDLFRPMEYDVYTNPKGVSVTAKCGSTWTSGLGYLNFQFDAKGGNSRGVVANGKVYKHELDKRNIGEEEVFQGMYDALADAIKKLGVVEVSDSPSSRKYWKNLGYVITNLNLKELKVKIAGEHTLVEAFIKNYEHEVDFYQEVAALVQDKLDTALQDAGIKAVISSRAKRPSRLSKKLEERAPKKQYRTFRDIYDDIIDLAGCRVALYMPADRDAVGRIIQKLFIEVRPVKHFPKDRGPEDILGYVADHYLVTLRPESLRHKELRYADTQIEIQVASVLMHAWAEVTHDLLYKPSKGELTHEELTILKDLNDLVQTGERQLEKLQNAIEGRTDEDLRFDIVAALQHLAHTSSLTVEEFRLQAHKIAGTAPAVRQAPQAERLIYLWPEGYSAPRIMQGGVSDHHLFMTPTKAYPTPLPNRQTYDDSYRGYATVSASQKRITLQPSENSLPYLKTVPQKVVDAFQQQFPQYEITVGKSQWASYMRARLAFLRSQQK